MKRTISILCTVLSMSFFSGVVAAKDVLVRGYTKRDGTYVQPYHRTAPDNTMYNNYSTKGNVNPYTGKAGTVDPLKRGNGR